MPFTEIYNSEASAVFQHGSSKQIFIFTMSATKSKGTYHFNHHEYSPFTQVDSSLLAFLS